MVALAALRDRLAQVQSALTENVTHTEEAQAAIEALREQLRQQQLRTQRA